MTRVLSAFAATAVALMASGCGGASDTVGGEAQATAASSSGESISLVAYSTPQVVYDQIIPAFTKTRAGAGASFKTSFGASGDQSRAVAAGQDADYVTFSIEPDMTRLVEEGLVAEDWQATPSKGLVTTSLVSFIVRKGNPKGIRTWADLLKPGVEVLTPNPFTSGAAKWNLLAAYGQAAQDGGEKAGVDYVSELIREHVKTQDKSGREALQSFLSGEGDVLLSYEYEATTAQRKGEELDYVVPDDTIRIDITAATTEAAGPQAKAFSEYVVSAPAQEAFASWGYRPVNADVLAKNAEKFPTPSGLFTIDDLGGWPKVNEELFDIEGGTIAKIEEEAGVPAAK